MYFTLSRHDSMLTLARFNIVGSTAEDFHIFRDLFMEGPSRTYTVARTTESKNTRKLPNC